MLRQFEKEHIPKELSSHNFNIKCFIWLISREPLLTVSALFFTFYIFNSLIFIPLNDKRSKFKQRKWGYINLLSFDKYYLISLVILRAKLNSCWRQFTTDIKRKLDLVDFSRCFLTAWDYIITFMCCHL